MDKLAVHGMAPLRACETVDAMPEILHRTFFIKGDLRREGETRLTYIPPHRTASKMLVVCGLRIVLRKLLHDRTESLRDLIFPQRGRKNEECLCTRKSRVVFPPEVEVLRIVHRLAGLSSCGHLHHTGDQVTFCLPARIVLERRYDHDRILQPL